MPLRQPDKEMLVPGSLLPWDLMDVDGRILLAKGTPVPDSHRINDLWTRSYYREIEESNPTFANATPSPWRMKPQWQEGAVPKFFQSVGRLSWQLEGFYCEILNGHVESFVDRFLEYVRFLQIQIGKDADAFLASMELFDEGRYGTVHALHSATLCELVSLHQGVRPEMRRVLIAAALTRDVGFLELQDELNLQKDSLNSRQQNQVRLHPIASARLIHDAGVRDKDWLSAIEQHHERLNGSGYPNELSGDNICPWARLLGIADIYSAMTKPRAYRPAFQGPNAIHSIFQTRGSLVDEAVTQTFIRVLGVYPPGALVRLSTDEIGVITRRTENMKCPELRVVADSSDKLLQIYHPRDLTDGLTTIQDFLPRSNRLRSRLNYRQLWGEGPVALRR